MTSCDVCSCGIKWQTLIAVLTLVSYVHASHFMEPLSDSQCVPVLSNSNASNDVPPRAAKKHDRLMILSWHKAAHVHLSRTWQNKVHHVHPSLSKMISVIMMYDDDALDE